MGGRGASVRVQTGGSNTASTIQQIQAAAANVVRNYTTMTDQQAQAIRDNVNQNYDIDTRLAIKQYISNAPDAQGYAMSQRLNYKLENNMPLKANEQYTHSVMQSAMHNLGQDTVLWRGGHDDILKSMGINMKSLQGMTDSQLNAAMTGVTFSNKAYMSTSYDIKKNPFLSASSGSGVSGGREVVLKINAPSTTQVVFGAKNQSEIIIGVGQNMRVTGAHFTGKTATPRNRGAMRQIQLDIDFY